MLNYMGLYYGSAHCFICLLSLNDISKTSVKCFKGIENRWFYIMYCDKRISIRYTVD